MRLTVLAHMVVFALVWASMGVRGCVRACLDVYVRECACLCVTRTCLYVPVSACRCVQHSFRVWIASASVSVSVRVSVSVSVRVRVRVKVRVRVGLDVSVTCLPCSSWWRRCNDGWQAKSAAR